MSVWELPGNHVVIVPGPDRRELRVITPSRAGCGRGEAHALNELYRLFLPSIRCLTELKFCDEVTFNFEEVMKHNVIFLGSGKTNVATERILQLLCANSKIAHSFSDDNNNLIAVRGGASEGYEYKESLPDYFEDYGLVIKADNPLSPGKKVYVFAGTTTLGTGSAALTLTSEPTLSAIESVYGSNSFELIIQSRFNALTKDPLDDPVSIVWPENPRLQQAVLVNSVTSPRIYEQYPIVSQYFGVATLYFLALIATGYFAAIVPKSWVIALFAWGAILSQTNLWLIRRKVACFVHPALSRLIRDICAGLGVTALAAWIFSFS
jgi:hypothetical protein